MLTAALRTYANTVPVMERHRFDQASLDRYPDRNYVDIASDGARTHSRKVIERRLAEEAAEARKAGEPAMA